MQRKFLLFLFYFFVFFFVSCNKNSNNFIIKGKISNLNNSEIYAYSLDNTIDGFDTLRVKNGEISHKIECKNKTIIVLVFPNYSETPLFLEPGEDIVIKADARNLRELEVEGTDDNELMTAFKKQIADASPPDVLKYAEKTIRNHPTSLVAEYVLRRYFIQAATPNYAKCVELTNLLVKEQPDNARLKQLKNSVISLQKSETTKKIAKFSAKDINGNTINSEQISNGMWIICVWASWNYRSIATLRQVQNACAQSEKHINILSINLDGSAEECRNLLKKEELNVQTICEEKLFNSEILNTLGLGYVPEIIILNKGVIVKHTFNADNIKL